MKTHFRGIALLIVVAAILSAATVGQAQPRPGRDRAADNPNGPDASRPGPWDQDVLVHRVSLAGDVTMTATFERAGVATLARLKDGRLIAAHQHFPENDPSGFDKVAVRFSSDEGKTWDRPQVIRLTGLPEGMRFPFDPTLVPLPDGKVRLYFTSLRGRRFDEAAPTIYSAVSDNGLDYTVEPGVRFAIEGRLVIDCAVVLHEGMFHLYAPDNGPQRRQPPGERTADSRPPDGVGYHATSKDGLEFTRVDDVRIDGRRNWLGCAQSDGERIIFFGTGSPGRPAGVNEPAGGVWMAASADGRLWRLMPLPPIPGADPGVVRATDGGWIVVSTGRPRPGTPGDRRPRPAQPPRPRPDIPG